MSWFGQAVAGEQATVVWLSTSDHLSLQKLSLTDTLFFYFPFHNERTIKGENGSPCCPF